jgi:hypothetical protein
VTDIPMPSPDDQMMGKGRVPGSSINQSEPNMNHMTMTTALRHGPTAPTLDERRKIAELLDLYRNTLICLRDSINDYSDELAEHGVDDLPEGLDVKQINDVLAVDF